MSTVHIPRAPAQKLELPRVCVTTGATEGVSYRDVTFHFVPLSGRLALAFCGLVGVVVFLVMKERATLSLPFTDAAWKKFDNARKTSGILAGLAIVAIVVMAVAFVGRPVMPFSLTVSGAFFAVAVAAFVVHHLLVVRGVGPQCRELTADHVVLELPSAAAAAAIHEHFGSLVAARDPTDTERDARDDELDRELRDM